MRHAICRLKTRAIPCAIATLVCGVLLQYSAVAVPTLPREEASVPIVSQTVTVAHIGADVLRLSTTAPSIPAGGTFRYSTRLTLDAPADHVWMRFRVRHPSGRLIFQRTRVATDARRGPMNAEFERGTDDLGLRPGVFPVEVEASIARDGSTETTSVAAGLLVYDPAQAPLTIALVARVSNQPLSGSGGRFVADPARYTRARDDARAVASWILSDPRARATLAVSPLLLEEWRRASEGYELVGPEGVEAVAGDSPVAREYAAALGTLSSALATGRLELAALGYADPDLSALADADMTDDVSAQYERGTSAAFASLETSLSTGTVPAGGCVPPEAARLLTGAGIGYAVVTETCVRTGDTTASPSSYRGNGGLTLLVSDGRVSAAVAQGDASRATALAFERLLDPRASGPLVALVELGPGRARTEDVLASMNALFSHGWIRQETARSVAAAPRQNAELKAGAGAGGDTRGYWAAVAEARRWTEAFVTAVGEGDPEAATARRDSLIAQSARWADPDGSWEFVERGRAFADAALVLATDTLDVVDLAVEPITLPGTGGSIPVSVRNNGERTLNVRMRYRTSDKLRIEGRTSEELELPPRETVLEVPVDLGTALAGTIHVAVVAGDVTLDEASVTVRASYLDRIVTGVGVAIVLGVLLVIVARRMRSVNGAAADGNG